MLNPITHRKVLEQGVAGRASVVEMGALDPDAGGSGVAMTLQVHVEGWTPYEVEGEWMVRSADTIPASGWILVRVDPDDLQEVAIDWQRVRAAAAAVAG